MAYILIIDDDAIYGNMLEQRLVRAGHHATLHMGPFGATIAARKGPCDLIILDVFMPGLDGGSLLDLMKKDGAIRPKVIFCSSMDSGPLQEFAQRHHADGSIPKSAGRQQLVDYVEHILERNHIHDARPRPKT
jgi:two-component system, OmpR family, response regulator